MKDRIAAVNNHSDICPTCLAIPKVKLSNGQCRGKHVIQARQDNKPNALCLHTGCELHHLICAAHKEENLEHSHTSQQIRQLGKLHNDYPDLKNKNVPQNYVLLATQRDPQLCDMGNLQF